MTGGRWAYYLLGLLVAVALLADVLANDHPVVVRYGGKLYYPALFSADRLSTADYAEADWAIWPPVPYAASTTNIRQPKFQPPLSKPADDQPRHWLGTDHLGRDILAGLIDGTRVAVWVGAGSLLISLLVGVPLGAAAGFFGNGGLRVSWVGLLSLLLGLPVGLAYATGSLLPLVGFSAVFFLMVVLCCGVAIGVVWLLLRAIAVVVSPLRRSTGLPVDSIALVMLELAISIPGLILLIAILSFVDRPPLALLIVTIGLLSWTPVARFLRAELMRIRELPYISAARMGGVGELRLLVRHALPNAIGPVVVVAAFTVGTSILAEAMLSFLGIGVPADQVTWGSLLRQSRAQPDAWWLAVFPGLLLTLTVLACNSLRGVGR